MELCLFLDVHTASRRPSAIGSCGALVHGDLKPRNVRITSAGQVKVLDFGIAKALSLSRKVTRNDFGTMPYLSPERLDTGDVNELADLWAVGVMLYEMVRGHAPFWAQTRGGWSSSSFALSSTAVRRRHAPTALRRSLRGFLVPLPLDAMRARRTFAKIWNDSNRAANERREQGLAERC